MVPGLFHTYPSLTRVHVASFTCTFSGARNFRSTVFVSVHGASRYATDCLLHKFIILNVYDVL